MKEKSKLDFVKLSKKVTVKAPKKVKITSKNIAVDYSGFHFFKGERNKSILFVLSKFLQVSFTFEFILCSGELVEKHF